MQSTVVCESKYSGGGRKLDKEKIDESSRLAIFAESNSKT